MTTHNESVCPGCKLRLPISDRQDKHRYIHSSSECWLLYTEVLATEYENPVLFGQIHQLTVDAYAAQHPGGEHPDKSIGLHLCGLFLALENHVPSPRISGLHQRLEANTSHWPHFPPPQTTGEVTVFDVAMADTHEQHAKQVRRWAESVWSAWSPYHGEIANLVGEQAYGQ